MEVKMSIKYHVGNESNDVTIITDDNEITLKPGIYLTPKAVLLEIEKRLETRITFDTVRKQIQNYNLGIALDFRRLLTVDECEKIIHLVGKRGKYERKKE